MLGAAYTALLAACSNVVSPTPLSPPQAPTQTQPAAQPAAQPRSGGTLRAGIQTDLPNVDPHYNAPAAYDALWIAFDRLIFLDNTLKPQPMLAESWDLTPDYKRVAFHLRKGVQFSTGRELTSDDVRYNLMRVRDPKVGGGQWVSFSKWWTIDTPDKYTVTLTSDTPRPLLFDFLETFNIIDHETAEGPNAKSQAVGTGPFVLKEWVQGDHVSLVKNPNYWQSGVPYLDGIEYHILPDAQAMMAQFEAGALDMALNPPLRDMARLKADPNYQAVTNPYSGRYYTAGWNVANAPLSDKRVRQALNLAMDRQRFVNATLVGLSHPISLPWIQGSPAYDEQKANYFTYDLDRARSLLSQAGAGQFSLEYLMSPNYAELGDFAQMYQADLAKLGITLTIKQVDSAPFFDAINNRTYPGMYTITSGRANLAPGITILSTQGFNPDMNNEGFKSDTYSQLGSAMSTETDSQRQKQIYSQMNDLLLDEAFCTAIAAAPPRMLLKSAVKGLDYTMYEGFVWTAVWLAS
jgi:peptide/nickel transport system substrate-binding protein